MDVLETLDLFSLTSISDNRREKEASLALETGKVLFFPALPFVLNDNEKKFLSPDILRPKSKNISYDSKTRYLSGTICQGSANEELRNMMHRFAQESRKLIDLLLPFYSPNLKPGRTSYRPAQISGRETSYRKDDRRLHVDSFPATPVKGNRILRVFSNVNPNNEPRIWKVGEPFPSVVEKMAPRVRSPLPGFARLLKLLKITKDLRTPYDHYMLKMHDTMKGDSNYQKTVEQQEIHFPTGSTWVVFTDQVSHAALSGQYLFEQTFYLSPQHLYNPDTSPLRVLERFLNRPIL